MSDGEPTAARALLEEEERKADEQNPVGWRDAVSLVVFGTLYAVVFLQFFTRYVLNDSLAWTEEAARALLIILAFVAGVRCQQRGTHIYLEFIDKYLPRHVWHLKLFGYVLALVFFSVAAWSTWVLIERTSFQMMLSLPFPKFYMFVPVLAALLVTVALTAWQIVRHLREGR